MKNTSVSKLIQLALLAAVVLIMSYTPFGYLNIGPLFITFLTIPVIIGAVMLGKSGGAFLGLVFGLTSFFKSPSSTMGAVLLSINPVYTFILSVVPRVLEGFLCGLVFEIINRKKDNKLWKLAVTSLSCPVLNTILYMSTLVALFYNTEYLQGLMDGKNVFLFVVGFVGLQAVVEAVVCTILGTLISKPLLSYYKKKS